MTADLLSNFIGMTLQATGNNNNAWGTILNGSALVPLERAIAALAVSHSNRRREIGKASTGPPRPLSTD